LGCLGGGLGGGEGHREFVPEMERLRALKVSKVFCVSATSSYLMAGAAVVQAQREQARQAEDVRRLAEDMRGDLALGEAGRRGGAETFADDTWLGDDDDGDDGRAAAEDDDDDDDDDQENA
jgi:hypothetical protein